MNGCSRCISSCLRWFLQAPKRKKREENTFVCSGRFPVPGPLSLHSQTQGCSGPGIGNGDPGGSHASLGGPLCGPIIISWIMVCVEQLHRTDKAKKTRHVCSLLDSYLLSCPKLSARVFQSFRVLTMNCKMFRDSVTERLGKAHWGRPRCTVVEPVTYFAVVGRVEERCSMMQSGQ